MRLNQKTADGLKLPEGKGELTVLDDDLENFGIRLRAGGSRTWFIRYYTADGTRRRHIIGSTKLWPFEKAFKKAKQLLLDADNGLDPAGEKQAKRAAVTVGELADDFLEYTKAHRKAATYDLYENAFRVHIKPAMGKLKAEAVSKRHVLALHTAIGKAGGEKKADDKEENEKTGDGKKADDKAAERKTGGEYIANRCLAALSVFYGFAASTGAVPDGFNPCRGVAKFKEHSRERLLSPKELAQLVDALDTLETEKAWPSGVAALRLLLFTGCRRNEILGLRWEHVDLEGKRLNLPDSKTGKKVVFLNTFAVEVLKRLEQIAAGDFVIVGRTPGKQAVGLRKLWCRAIALAKLPGLRLHDTRHAFASVAVASNLGLPIVGAALGHHNVRTTQKYAHLAESPVAGAVQVVGDKMLEMIEAGRKIVEIENVKAAEERAASGA